MVRATYISMENKLVSGEDLKHFHTSLLGNEEDAKRLAPVIYKDSGLNTSLGKIVL